MDKKNIEAIYPLSPAQLGMLLYLVVAGDGERSNAFYEQYHCTLHGDLDPELFREAWERTVARHASLRTLFLWERREKPLQVVLRSVELPFTVEDWRGRDAEQGQADFDALRLGERAAGLKLDRAPLVRCHLRRVGDRAHRFLWCFSHLTLDGWSIALVLGEVFSTYHALTEGKEPSLPAAKPFRDYIAWLQDQDLAEAERFWRRNLEGIPGATSLPIDRGAGTAMTDAATRLETTGRQTVDIDPGLWSRIQEVARSRGLTPNAFFQGTWGLLLGRYAGEDDVVYGSVVSGRTPEVDGVESIAGMFINALPVRARLDPARPFAQWLGDLQLQLVEQRQFEYCPLEQIQRWIGLPHDRPAFESLLAYENYPAAEGESDLRMEVGDLEEVSNYPLLCYVVVGERPRLRLAWDRSRYSDDDARALLRRYARLLSNFADSPDTPIGQVPLTTVDERTSLDRLAAAPAADWPDDACVHQLVARAAERTPGAVALRGADGSEVTYRQLVDRSRRLGRHLSGLGVGPDAVVAVSMERSPAMVVALLGVLEAGGAYLPLDPDYPRDRLAFMLEDSGARVLVAQEDLADRFPAVPHVVTVPKGDGTVFPELSAEPVDSGVGPEHLAYVIYTSGSTGKPKGVQVEHRNLVHYAEDARRVYGLRADDRVLQFATISFDTSAEETYPALFAGAALVLRSEEMIASPGAFLKELGTLGITLLNLPTAFWHEVCAGLAGGGEDDDQDGSIPACLERVIIGGEAALAGRLEQWHRHLEAAGRGLGSDGPVRLWNTYGPTETTIVTTRHELTAWHPEDHGGEVPIGRPIDNARAYVLDPELRPLPPGIPGELAVGGPGVTRGYLGRPELTAERFPSDPIDPSRGRVYRTGDRVAMAEDGTLLFRGRVDQQVKVRGFRIEPGEIESALLRHDAVHDAVVVARVDGADTRLVAYFVAAEGHDDPSLPQLREALAADLPDYMVPAAFVSLDALPMTPSGKVDRRALPAPDASALGSGVPHVAPRTPIESALRDLWVELLGHDRIGVHDDFFQLGGHSLLVGRLVTRVRKEMRVELPLVAVFENPTLAELAQRVEAGLRDDTGGTEPGSPGKMVELPPIVKVDRDGPLPLSYPQERIWFLQMLEPNSVAYNFQMTVWFDGPLNVEALRRSLTEIVRRHEVFHAVFPEVDGKPAMVIEGPWEVELPVIDLRHVPEIDREDAAERALRAETAKAFDITQLPLIRWHLVRLEDQRHMLIQVEHHFVHDGWSLGILLRELLAIYKAYSAGEPSPLPELDIQFGDFTSWQRRVVAGETLGGLVDHWKRRLDGMPMVLDLPTDHPRPNRPSTQGEAEMFPLPDDLYAGLRSFGKDQGYTLYMTTLAAFYALMYRYTGQTDMGVGAGVANRRQREQEGIIGFTVNTVVMRGDLSGDPTFLELLARVRETSLDAFAHQDMPFEKLVEALRPERHVSRNPIFQVMFSFHDAAVPRLDFGGGLLAKYLVRTNRSAKTDLNVIIAPQAEQQVGMKQGEDPRGKPQRAVVTWEYNRELFEPETIDRMIEHYKVLALDAITHPTKRLSELDMLTDGERGELGTWSSRPAPFPREATIHGLFQGIADERPAAAAVRCGDDALTYGELASRASRLARHLRSLGVGPETAVALALSRGIELVTAQLAVLEAGGFFVPLDPAYPAERLRVMLEDTGAALVLSLDGEAGGGLPADLSEGLRVVDLGNFDWNAGDGSPLADGPAPAADNLAYVMFTSGSTGRPKGVAVSHRNVVRLVRGNDFAAMDEDEVWMGFAPAAFDASTLEIWAPLLNGGELIQLPAGDLDLGSLAAEIRSAGVTSLWLTAGLFHPMAEGGHLADLPSVRQLLAGGDSLSADRIRDALDQLPEGARVINGYGPTENTTFTTCHPMTRGDDIPASVPIGRPIRNTRVLVTDPDLRPVAGGVYGELLAGGDGLARGYFGRPALTAERFVPDPSATEPGDRVYRTGDRARWLRDGTLEFQGRVDFQVKIRGFRIEPGEIQAVLGGHPNVADAAVIARDDGSGGKRLVAYVVPGPAALEGADFAADLRTYLGSRLPDYMVPTAFVRMGTLPLNANGKVDRTALPAPDAGADADEVHTPPSSPVEELVADLWADVLGLGGDSLPLDIHTDFFALGGHSLIAMQLMARLREQLGVELPLRRLFQANTVAAMAEVVAEQLTEGLPKALPLVAQDGPEDQPLPLSFAQQRLWFLYRYDPASSVYNMPSARRLQGDLDVDALARALTEIARRHRVLRSRFEEQDGQVVQVATPLAEAGLPLPVDDLRNVEESDARVTEGLRRLREAAAEPFDLEAGDVFRANLYRLADDDHLLLVSLHHIVFDGISLGVFERELAALYGAYRAGESPDLPELSVQYGDFAAWQRDYLAGDALERQLDYWRGALVGADEPLELPADRPRPATPSYRGDSVLVQLPPELMDRLSALSRERGVTPFMTLLAAFQMLLGRLSGQDRVRVGSPVSGRQQTRTEGLIGFFVNNLVFGADLADDPAFVELLGRTRDTVLSGFAHQDVPFEKLVEELQPQRDTARNPLFQVGFQLFDTGDAEGGGLADLETGWLEPPLTVAKFDLNLTVLRSPRGMAVDVRYATDLFDRGTVERWLEAYLAVLQQVAGDPARRLSALDLRNDADRALLTQVNDVAADYPQDVGLAELFGRAAEAHGDRVAVAWGGHTLTYSGLASGARRLARHLVAQGVRPGERVGLCVARGADMVTGMLGILEAGGAYVPLDPDYPADRLRFMAEDTGMRRMVVHRALSARLPDLDVERIVLEDDAEAIHSQADGPLSIPAGGGFPAYVIYTSGSTGRPKGVVVPQRAVASLVLGTNFHDFRPEDVIAQASNANFDAATFEIWGALLHGARIVGVDRDTLLDPQALGRHVEATGIDVAFLTTALFQQLAREAPETLGRMRAIFYGGERCDPALVRRAVEGAPSTRISHVYGPTEATTFATYLHLEGVPEDAASVPIGGPLANTTVHVVDRWGRPAPAQVPGELLLGGDGLAMGYHARPALTAAAFVPDPDGDGGRVYRTGDLVRLLADGSIDFMGRIDHQVKIRGFRIELGEVDAVLAGLDGVEDCITVVQGTGAGQRLVSFAVLGDGSAATAPSLQGQLRGALPEFAVPTVHVLDALPLNANGKVDRKALPELAPGTVDGGDGAATLPRDAMEEMVEAVFAEVLGVDAGAGRLDVHDDFFALGGHSLLATQLGSRLRDRLGVEVALREIFHHPTVAELARRITELRAEEAGAVTLGAITPVTEDADGTVLSFAQQRMWFLQRFDRGSSAYNMPFLLRLRGTLDLDALGRAVDELVQRHPVLRTRYVETTASAEVRQRVDAAPDSVLVRHDLSSVAPEAREASATELLRAEGQKPFDLAQDPGLRAHLAALGDDDHLLLLAMHHVACDGWSWGVLRSELEALYLAFANHLPSPLPKAEVQYADFAAWQRSWLDGAELERQMAFWHRSLGGSEPLDLGTDRPRPAVMSHRGGRLTFALSEDLSDGLRRLARSSGSTLYMTLLAALQALLHRLTSQDHISIGSPVAGRRRSELEGVVGLFVNTVVLRTDLGGNPTFDDLLAQVREVSLDAFAHQDVPFEKLVDELAPERDPSRNPLFQVGFQVLEGVSEPREPAGDVSFSELQAAVPHAKFDLDLHVVDGGGGLQGSLIYCADLFEESTVRRLLGTFEGLLTAAVADPGQKLSELPVMTGEARAHLLAHAATPRTPDDPHGANLAELFAEVAARHGDRTAVQDGDTSLTYAELARRADAWAASLRRRGVRPEVPVGLLLDRGADLVTAMVAVIRAGGAYLPLDPSYPAERLRFMLEDTGAPLVIAHGDLLGDAAWLSDSTEVVRVDGGDLDGTPGEPLTAPDLAPGSLAYVTYTSGSTGRPKGVATPHRGVVNLVRGNDDYPFRKDDRVGHTANAAFDPTTLQVWGPLLAGGCVVPLDPGTVLSPQRLAAAVRERGITVLNLTAALFHQLAEHGPEAMGGLRALLSGGDRCDPHWARAAAGTGVGHLLNHYGPTEATTSCIVHRVEDLSEDAATVPIGRPMAGSSAYVIDRHGGLAAPGVAGELWIGGDGLARGYLGRPALTAAAFVPNPFADAPGERLYRSGDLVRRLPNGDLDFLGRIDHQVKLRGYRIELGEVEAALRSHGDVTSALVMLRDGAGGQRRLVAYVEAGDGADADALQAHVAERLPSYMVPAAVVVLDSFPLTPNGKVDRAALPEPQGADGDRRVRPPKTEAEITLAGIWEEVLGVESVGLDDNFFRLGGDSILAIRVVTQAFRAGLDLDPQDFFLLDTLEALAAAATPVTEVTEGPDGDAPDDDLALDEEALGDVFAELGLD